jgi:hypothetical protein
MSADQLTLALVLGPRRTTSLVFCQQEDILRGRGNLQVVLFCAKHLVIFLILQVNIISVEFSIRDFEGIILEGPNSSFYCTFTAAIHLGQV